MKWQVALFALMPLMLGAMAQPVGRVLDHPARYSLWMRSSPILCAGDMLHFLARYADRCYREPTFLANFKAELAYRFRDDEASQDKRDIERTALVRWIMILLGGIPCQTIKLGAMQGVPLTKTVGLLFFISLVFGEVINISASTMVSSHLTHLPEPSLGLPQARTSIAPAMLRVITETAQHFIVPYTTFTLLRHELLTSAESMDWGVVLLIWLILSPNLVHVGARRDCHHGLALWALSLAGWVAGFQTCLAFRTSRGIETAWNLWLIVTASGLLFFGTIIGMMYAMSFIATWAVLARLIGKAGDVRGFSVDEPEQDMITAFLWTAALFVLYYSSLFDGTGTYNPSWTGVFG